MIEVTGLSKRFTQGLGRKARVVQAVDHVSWRAGDAAITGVLGPNGAGKTTTLRMVAGLIVPDDGSCTVDGIDVAREPRAALARLGVLSDARGLYPRLTARENIVYYGQLQGMSAAAAAERAEALAQLLQENDVPGSRVFTMADIFRDPHFAARGTIVHAPDKELGAVAMPAPAPRLSATPGSVRHAGGVVGADTVQVLRTLGGFTPAEIERLLEAGAAYDAAHGAAQRPALETPA